MPVARDGNRLQMAKQTIHFSCWPVGKGSRRYGVQHRLFSADPWPLIANAIEDGCTKSARAQAHAFRAQAEDFYETSKSSRIVHAKPLLLYYAMLNVAKAFVLTKGTQPAGYTPHHGLSEKAKPGQISGAVVHAKAGSLQNPSAFADFLKAMCGASLPIKGQRYKLREVLPQILHGHRLWCEAAGKKERFIGVSSLEFFHNSSKQLWVRIVLDKDDIARTGLAFGDLVRFAGLGSGWQAVRLVNNEQMVCLEKKMPDSYTHRPSDHLMKVIEPIRHRLWSSVLTLPPYTRYYLYLAPPGERPRVLPQMLSIYLIMFFLGSITRYRPYHFENILGSEYGSMIESFVNEAPSQFLYLIATELKKRDVSKPAIA